MMNKMDREYYIKLMNREIDGENSPEERAILKEYLASDRSEAEYFEGLKKAAAMLEEAEELDVPGLVRENIMRRIRSEERKGPDAERTPLSIFRGCLQPIWGRGLACGLAAGLAVGACVTAAAIYYFGEREPLKVGDFYGSVLVRDNEAVSRFESFEFSEESVSGSVRAGFYDNDMVLVSLKLESASRAVVVLDLAEQVAFEGITASRKPDFDFQLTGGGLRISHSGSSEYVLQLKNRSGSVSPVGIRIFSKDRLILERRIFQND